jgi:DEAD/DEAH box helicase domain-containing protein
MLPAHLAENIRKQVLYYLQSTFDFRDHEVGRAFDRFLQDPENGIFKGPWVQLRRPFRPAEAGIDLPFDIKPPFHPFRHQWQAWRRLSSKGQSPQPTLVTTGTGSGKTECFLYPLLDHCLRMRQGGQKGIKAIILYPMNALAADQEKRFAKAVWSDPILKAAGIRVGNYTGRYDPADPGAAHDSGTKAMGEDHGISNHEVQQDMPPDILLTNYKMLDFLLLRPQDQRLWRFNEPSVLRYLVLDELHTYDGAQGADVACLIRRLKERLELPRGELCVVGTSATLDDRGHTTEAVPGTEVPSDTVETSGDRLARFASTLFEEDVPTEAVIGEDRLTVEEIVHAERTEIELPDVDECVPREDEDVEAYARRQSLLWGGPSWQEPADGSPQGHKAASETWAIELGDWLKGTAIFERLLSIFERSERDGDGPLSWNDLVERLIHADLAFADIPEREKQKQIIVSLFALVAQARERRSGVAFPLVPTQVQLWIRELARLGRVVSDLPAFGWLDEPASGVRSLPAFHCSECGESGWIGVHDPSRDTAIESQGVSGIQLDDDPRTIYNQWFGYKGSRGQKIVVISPWPGADDPSDDADADGQQTLPMTHWYFCPLSLVLRQGDGPCPITGDGRRFRVRLDRNSRKTKSGRVEGIQGCPACGARDGVFIIGTRSATISSVVIDEMFGSILNSDPKLLAFTDSVQDASHRAGFFTARTYNFTFRTALQHLIEDVGDDGVSLPQSGALLLDWWGSPGPGRPGSVREAMASLMPPDLQEYEDFLKYRNSDSADDPPSSLRRDIESRLTWQATSEFGVMQLHGRSMEESGSACVAWDAAKIESTLQRLRERLESIDTTLCAIPEGALSVWLYGVLHRYRVRGAIDHPYLMDLATKNFWGKYPFGRTVPGREAFPPLHRFRPQLMVTRAQRDHQHVLASTTGGLPPWHVKWAYRALRGPVVQESGILDLIGALLEVGSEAGLFRKLHQDGSKAYYAIAADATRLCPGGSHLVCTESGRSIVRPADEATHWADAPSLEYYADRGHYELADYTPRQHYYQDRYRKGALRRVVANEHTGLLATEEREKLEHDFATTKHTDDPNVLTCTSTLEMGIDIGDLSSTMLCSIPPRTANYLQRIGRAGRATGTALIVSVINQRPHDLFFYARPIEMLRGRVDPPGCWLDASAVLVRQYLAFCFDSATKAGELPDLPPSGAQFVRDMDDPKGRIPTMMSWVAANEADLRSRFLRRFHEVVRDDTRERFLDETTAELLLQRLHAVAQEFDRARRELENARKRLNDQLSKLDEGEDEARQEIEQELHILKGRQSSLGRTTTLEVLTDHGLLPNYAFPERGVRFYGSVYNRHRRGEREIEPIEVVRPAASAIRELAPGNHFYTHRRKFDIQQLSVGNPQDPLIETWAICGSCGHMRRKEDLEREDALPACPQCGYDGASDSQADRGQQRQFIEFARSQALSYMEQYDSMSGDRNDERERAFYLQVRSFDLTDDDQIGAVGEDGLPFGVEYRAAVTLREANVGFDGEPATVRFGPGQEAPEIGFSVLQALRHCGWSRSVDRPSQAPSELQRKAA